MLKKSVSAVLAVLICSTVLAAPAAAKKKKRLAPGASCYAWNENTKNKPDSIPAGGFVDEAVHFHAKNIRACDELRELNVGKCFILWKGYLRVNKAGSYRFTLAAHGWTRDTTIKVFLNNQPILTKIEKGETTVSGQAAIKRGFVPIVIYFNPGFEDVNFSLKYAPVNSMKMTNIIPSSLYHTVEEEE